ncbi:hypothetical protein POSPLADRAFT_1156904 [Postia placenta MAD-698-R-SB12]|uniref:Uncharacterized protein n=1 Tax=Postia placenta MAD-698-R-SB12 TaxID=670580 RepID=A0A1X6MLU8_9APHY|nr:hypothetical protein POSPLADRAFT_1156904 [Postia placenta MAD-698-R-SB12]OSX57350.1 hypothetical protein POSPLADRAFT_1156904 [Postia placenta MAD-698-R-SB12]
MCLSKIPFLVAGTIGAYITLTPPHPQASPTEYPRNVTAYERILFSSAARFCAGNLKLLSGVGGLLEICVILASRWPTHPLSRKVLEALVPGSLYRTNKIGYSAAFLLGCSIAVIAGFVRYKCYRELERLYTFELTIQQDHRLVTTGLYAYVRYLSYTSGIACSVGLGVCLASSGSWLKECGVLDTFAGKFAAWLYVGYTLWGTVAFVIRAPLEDALMKEQFGEEWNKWAQRVPYRLIPYVF